jgi:hypothetical protein
MSTLHYYALINSVLQENKRVAQSNSYISRWNSWYKGNVANFHNYRIYNGAEHVRMQKLCLQMAKRGCEDWASLLMNEKVDVVIKDKDRLHEILFKHDFWTKANKAVEFGFALSMSALVINIIMALDENDNLVESDIRLDVYNANRIVPITIENNQITECAFITENTNNTIIAIHLLNPDGTYKILKVTTDKITNEMLTEEIQCGTYKPLFAIIQPNLVNNLDVDSPYPISIFANAIDTLKAIDNKYDSYNNEFVLGRKRVYISAKANKVNRETGAIERTFDPQDIVFYQLPEETMQSNDKPFVKTDTDQLRSMEHKSALQDELNLFASKIGLGNDYYNFEKGRVMTATQVISEKSDTFRNKRKHEILLERAVIDIVEALIYTYNKFVAETPIDYDGKIEVKFDDSIIEDTEAQKTSDRADVANGVMSKIEYRMKWYGEDEETATNMVNKYYGDVSLQNRINAFIPALQSNAMTPTQFVELVYGNVPDKQELIDYITKNLSGGANITQEDLISAGITTQPTAQERLVQAQQLRDLSFGEGE